MKTILYFLLHLFLLMIRALQPGGIRRIAAENMALRQQLLVVSRKQKRAPKLFASDRFLLGFVMTVMSLRQLSKIAVIIKPATLLKFHQALVERKYRLLFTSKTRTKPGSKGPSQEIIDLIVEIKRKNPRLGYRRIAMQIANTFHIELDKDVVRRILAKIDSNPSGSGGSSWLTFFGHRKDSLWSLDLFRCESILLKTHWVLVLMDQFTRRIIGFAGHAGHVDGVTLCCLFNKLIANQSLPLYLSSDHDPLFQCHQWQANLRILAIEEIKTVPYVPISHPFIERLICTVRQKLLDQTLFWNKSDLQNKLTAFMNYYHHERCHWSIDGKTPLQKAEEGAPKIINRKYYQ